MSGRREKRKKRRLRSGSPEGLDGGDVPARAGRMGNSHERSAESTEVVGLRRRVERAVAITRIEGSCNGGSELSGGELPRERGSIPVLPGFGETAAFDADDRGTGDVHLLAGFW